MSDGFIIGIMAIPLNMRFPTTARFDAVVPRQSVQLQQKIPDDPANTDEAPMRLPILMRADMVMGNRASPIWTWCDA